MGGGAAASCSKDRYCLEDIRTDFAPFDPIDSPIRSTGGSAIDFIAGGGGEPPPP